MIPIDVFEECITPFGFPVEPLVKALNSLFSVLLDILIESTNFENDSRIKFVGTVYDKDLIKKIRENAYGYFHGHEVGGTNPSLLEALASTKLNLLLEVGFNKEVGENGALYWSKKDGNLAKLINKADKLTEEEIGEMSKKAKERINTEYSWDYIVERYERVLK